MITEFNIPKNTLSLLLLMCVASAFLAFGLPGSWMKSGTAADSYEATIDNTEMRNGKNSVTIKSVEKDIKGFCSVMQSCLPGKFLIRRIRLTGYLKTKDVNDWAGIWLRVDDQVAEKPLSFDNMNNRKITGSTEWQKCEIVVDVPANAASISYGGLLSGSGQIWISSFNLEVVPNTVATTGSGNNYNLPLPEPVNMNFDEK